MVDKKRLLILGPSYRRRRDQGLLPALERFDGLFFRVARKYLSQVKNIDVLVMVDDLTLVEGNAPLPYHEPKGREWGRQSFSVDALEKARVFNEKFLEKKLRSGKYSEVFLAMGKIYAEALPNMDKYNVTVVFPTKGGPGPKAQALKNWIA